MDHEIASLHHETDHLGRVSAQLREEKRKEDECRKNEEKRHRVRKHLDALLTKKWELLKRRTSALT